MNDAVGRHWRRERLIRDAAQYRFLRDMSADMPITILNGEPVTQTQPRRRVENSEPPSGWLALALQ